MDVKQQYNIETKKVRPKLLEEMAMYQKQEHAMEKQGNKDLEIHLTIVKTSL